MTILSAFVRVIGWPACIIMGLLAFYEGIPGAHRIPFLSSMPVLGDLATGRVHAFAAQQVAFAAADAARQCEADKKQMVSLATVDALAAVLAQERRNRAAADIAAADAQKRAGEALRAKEDAENRIEALKAQAKDLPTWSPEELLWLENH